MYRYVPVDGIHAFDFGEEWAVFNPLSWDAHLLNPAAASVLQLLTEGADSVQAVTAHLREVLVATEQQAAPEHARRLLDQLVRLGLVRTLASNVAADL